MKAINKYFRYTFLILISLTSCTKDDIDDLQNIDVYAIRFEINSNGKTTHKYSYNNIGKISEGEGLYFYQRYTYNKDGQLSKRETGIDPSKPLYSSAHLERKELLTAENSTITMRQIYSYDPNGSLIEIENYSERDGSFVYVSMNSFIYEGEQIIRKNIHNEKDSITQFHTYEYDNRGNVQKEIHYSYLFIAGNEPRKINESTFKYDNKNNPFIIYKDLGNPGLFSNTNNVIETNSTSYIATPGIDEYSTSKTSYEYNRKNYPIKVISENSVYEYKYEY